MKKTILLFAGLAFLTFKTQAQTVTDYDGNVYNTVTIGTQVWMQENLKVKHYHNGDSIPNVTDNTQWSNLTSGAYCNYNNTTNIDTINTYGRLYNWYTVVDSHNVCPTDWHVPSNTEWAILITYLGGNSIAGGKLKDTTLWNSPNTGATNESGFTALPGGYRYVNGAFNDVGKYGRWWSSTEYDTIYAICEHINYNDSQILSYYGSKNYGNSVRCVCDSLTTQINENSIDKHIQIYPNPATDRVYINITERQNLKMQVYNIIGDCVFQSVLTSGTNKIDISSLTKGIYIIKLTGTDWAIQRKLTKG